MNASATPLSSTTSERILKPQRGFVPVNFGELWRYRELFLFLAWRDILVRYKQTALGIAWAILQPLLTMLIFTVIFGKIGKFPSNNAPYAIMTFAALLPWQYFANALSESSNSLVASANMISKVYFPRLIVPASSILSGFVDFAISLGLLILLMFWYGVPFSFRLLLLPVFFAMATLCAFAVGVWMSALNVKYRDVKYVVPFFTRMGMFASPVAYLPKLVLDNYGPTVHFLYCLNPMVGVIDGFRWCILGEKFTPYWPGFWGSAVLVAVVLASGLYYFRTTEKRFADVI